MGRLLGLRIPFIYDSSEGIYSFLPCWPKMLQYRAFLLLTALAQVSLTLASKNPKRGLAFADGDTPGNVDIKKANTSSGVVSWQYNWGATPPDYLSKSGIPFIPMQWGTNGIANFASSVKSQGAKTILVVLSHSTCFTILNSLT